MASRSLNRVQLIGNLTRDPELRYTPNQKAVATFTVATTRRWVTNGTRKDETEFHRIVAWDKLAEICAQILTKGSKVFVEGRLHYRNWTTAENVRRDVAEVIITDMILLVGGKQSSGPRPATGGAGPTPPATGDQMMTGVPSDVAGTDMSLSDDDLDVIELPEDDLPFETKEPEVKTGGEEPAEAPAEEKKPEQVEAADQETKQDQAEPVEPVSQEAGEGQGEQAEAGGQAEEAAKVEGQEEKKPEVDKGAQEGQS
ncbi:MAG: single-stranded DNA-binding protein [bacterium]|nr:single-stranded DNA-binding protein [bacterium]